MLFHQNEIISLAVVQSKQNIVQKVYENYVNMYIEYNY